MSASRRAILERIRAAVGDHGATREADYAAIPRAYRTTGTIDREARVALFVERLEHYQVAVHRTLRHGVRQTVAQVLKARGKRSLVVAPGVPGDWLPLSIETVPDRGLSHADLDRAEGVLTGCACAIAETGTIVLYHTGADGRRALSLIPDYHLCVVDEAQVVETVPEAIRAAAAAEAVLVTTISGPSATADIEMTRIKGVHGPRTLDVVLAG